MLNRIVWTRTVFDIETIYLWETELFEIELFNRTIGVLNNDPEDRGSIQSRVII